jgi:hypothetical protein
MNCYFALKHRTAVSLFLWDLPCLSVDIDLIQVPVANRASTPEEIDASVRWIGVRGSSLLQLAGSPPPVLEF